MTREVVIVNTTAGTGTGASTGTGTDTGHTLNLSLVFSLDIHNLAYPHLSSHSLTVTRFAYFALLATVTLALTLALTLLRRIYPCQVRLIDGPGLALDNELASKQAALFRQYNSSAGRDEAKLAEIPTRRAHLAAEVGPLVTLDPHVPGQPS